MIKLTDLYAEPGVAPTGWQQVSNDRDAFGAQPPVKDSDDIRRIMALPRRPQVEVGSTRAAALVRMMNARFGRERDDDCPCNLPRDQGGHNRDCIRSLNPAQAWALYEIGTTRGLLGPIGVGHGKTILNILAVLALAHGEPDPGKYEAVLLLPPNLIDQLLTEYQLLGEHFRVPTLSIHGRDDYYDAGAGAPILHVLAYSRLQRPEATVLLDRINKDGGLRAIIADEVHAIRNANAVRTDRVMRFFRNNPRTMFVCWSGSITDSSLTDYAHLSELALRMSSPVPRDPEVAKEWASALDPKSDWPANPGALLEGLVASGCQLPGEHVYRGFHRRLVETEGVVATQSSAIPAELQVVVRAAPPIPDEPVQDERAEGGWFSGLATLMRDVRESGIRPDGEVLLDPLQKSRCLRELACGFFYRWIYPKHEPEDVIEEWLKRRKRYRWEVREALKERRDHFDSPLLVQLAAMRFHGDISGDVEVWDENLEEYVTVGANPDLPRWASEHWPAWRDIRNQVEPETEAVWISTYLAEDSASWAAQNRGVVWYDKSAFGQRVAELAGLPLHGGGEDCGPRLIGGKGKSGKVYPGEDGSRSSVCSLKSHGTGRDGLQRIYCTQLVANPPSSATSWEQLLGRLHRIGQRSPVVRAEFYAHTEEMAAAYSQARARASYVQATIGAQQKLMSGSDDSE